MSVKRKWPGMCHLFHRLNQCVPYGFDCEQLLALEEVVQEAVDEALRRERKQPRTLMEAVRWGLKWEVRDDGLADVDHDPTPVNPTGSFFDRTDHPVEFQLMLALLRHGAWEVPDYPVAVSDILQDAFLYLTAIGAEITFDQLLERLQGIYPGILAAFGWKVVTLTESGEPDRLRMVGMPGAEKPTITL